MGEPLNNYEAVRSATSMMIDPALFSLRRSKVTISTVGIVPRILQVRCLYSPAAQPDFTYSESASCCGPLFAVIVLLDEVGPANLFVTS